MQLKKGSTEITMVQIKDFWRGRKGSSYHKYCGKPGALSVMSEIPRPVDLTRTKEPADTSHRRSGSLIVCLVIATRQQISRAQGSSSAPRRQLPRSWDNIHPFNSPTSSPFHPQIMRVRASRPARSKPALLLWHVAAEEMNRWSSFCGDLLCGVVEKFSERLDLGVGLGLVSATHTKICRCAESLAHLIVSCPCRQERSRAFIDACKLQKTLKHMACIQFYPWQSSTLYLQPSANLKKTNKM